MRRLLAATTAALLLTATAVAGQAAAASRATTPTASPAQRWALLVGVSRYAGSTSNTVGGANDARLVRTVLLRNGWRSDHIRLLVDGQATGGAISAGLSWLQARSGDTTFSLFHYSGHVRQTGGHEYLWGSDNTFLRDDGVARVLRAVRGTAWTDLSGCEAGGFDEGIDSARHLFTASSRASEKSYERPAWGLSVWTGLLFDQALRSGRADGDHDGRVSVQEAVHWAGPRAAATTANQRPYGPQHPVRRGFAGSLRLDAPRTLR